MSDLLSETPHAAHWPEVYRFAFLATGGAVAAQQAVERTVAHAAGRLGQIRDERQAKRWLFAQARECCRQMMAEEGAASSAWAVDRRAATGGGEDDHARRLAQLFALLPEPERAALALFYLYIFEPGEIAELLEIKPAAVGPLLLRARELLQAHRERCQELLAAAPLGCRAEETTTTAAAVD